MGLKIRDRGLNRIVRALAADNLAAKVGIQGVQARQIHKDTLADASPNKLKKKLPLTNVQLGVVHEFGSPKEGIPSRSFLRTTADEQRDKYLRMALRGIRRVIDTKGMFTTRQMLGQLAEQVTADVKKKIRSNIQPGLKSSQRKRRIKAGKGTRTLVIEGELLGSITPHVGKL